TEDGQTAGHGDAVTVTGSIATDETGGCSIDAAEILSASVVDIEWPAGEARSIDDVCAVAEGSWVRVTGPLALPSLLSSSGGRYSLDLLHSDARARFKIGDGVNQMRDVPDDYQLDDLMVETMDGTMIGQGDPAMVHGVLTLYSEGCAIEVATVSGAEWSDIEWPKFSEASVADVCTQTDGSWVKVTGQLDLPAFVSGFSGTYNLNFSQSNNPDVSIRVSVPIGDGANEIRPLPDEYALTDLQIETIDGVMVTHGDIATVMGPIIAGDDGDCIIDVVEISAAE
ncbi:MAG: hypothetical protein GY943_19575, partial [Chloroflexi bacterium]|nr:hypothetical protein [Chloroflexota bacterium]